MSMSGKEIGIGLLGMGTVGGGVASLLQVNEGSIRDKAGSLFNIKKVLVRDPAKTRTAELPSSHFTSDVQEILQDPEIELVVELLGGIEPARDYIKEALQKGKYVVTANKDVMAKYGTELLSLARENNSAIFYEASAGGGIPLVRPLQHCLAANRIHRFMGIINGTTNYILTRMSLEGMEFADALQEAQDKGFAEADPSSDLEGWDAAYKLVILSRLAFGGTAGMDDVYMQGIDDVSAQDLEHARSLGYTIKLLAVGEMIDERLSMRVFPALLPLKHPLSSVYNEFNALFVEGNAVGEVMFYGKGAGAMPTASAVVSDMIDASRCLNYGITNGLADLRLKDIPVIPGDEMTSSFYLRLQAEDKPGVFASLANTFGNEEVSLDMILQDRSEGGTAEIVLVTHDVRESNFFKALSTIREMPHIRQINGVFRVVGKEKEQL